MRRIIAFALFALLSAVAYAQAANCLCTGTGCKIAADSYPSGTGQPTSCTVYKAGVVVASAPVVASSSIAGSNALVCQPASPAYIFGPAGSVSCLVAIPAQPLGNVTLTMTATNAAGESVQSAPFTFNNVVTLSTLPAAAAGLRAVP